MTLEFNQAEESVISIDNVIGNIDLSLSVESSSVEAMPVDVVLSSSNELNIEVVLDNQEVPLSVVIEPQMALEVAITTNDSIDFTVDVNTDTNKGDKGDTGEAGPQGPRGPRGDKGDRGDLGATGVTGPAGSTGLDGAKGDNGDKGDIGLTGAKGDQGIQGNQGFKGDKGDTGPAGEKGDTGQNGLTTSVNWIEQIDGNITLTKADIGLGSVDDTSDLNKPISIATQSALDLKLEISLKGAANGLAELDSSGFVKNTQLPSYVDDVLEYSSLSLFPAVGESGKIYIDTATNLTYRWSGSTYALISQSLALGETSLTAYRGDRGKIAYDHSQIILGNPHNVSKADVGLSNVPNLSFSGSNTGDQTLSGLGGQPKLNGTGFVKASGTTISYDNSSYYLASNPNNYISGITKAQVESVLTGLITSHTHNYLSSFTETDPIFTAWNKSTGISITKSQVSDFPTNLSQFTNNLGNYGGWITGITSGMVTTALGYTPYNSSNPNSYITASALTPYSLTTHTHSYLPTAYIGGQQLNPQTYFSPTVGLKVAMTANIGVWSDTLWINGYSGGDVLNMCALHFWRNGQPRMFISSQASNATTYGTTYEIISSYNIGSQSVNYANSSGSAGSISNFTVSINRSDSNDYSLPGRTTGMYAITGGGTNGPGSVYLNLLHMSNATDVAFQIAGGYTSDNMYFRGTSNLANGTNYTPWRTVIHSGNIGSQNVQFANVASNCTNASYVNHYQSRTDAAWYNVVWASGSPSPMYSCDAIQIQSSTGIIKANNFTLGSDIRIKTEIKPISLEYIDIQYKEFELLSNLGEKRYGVIAQELLLLGHPELVSGSDTEMYSVKYIDLFVKEIAYLKNEVKLLKDEIQKLKSI